MHKPTTLQYTEAGLYVVELSPDAQSLVASMGGNLYNILCGDYRNVNGSFVGAGAGGSTTTTFDATKQQKRKVDRIKKRVKGRGKK
jgi:hypothetical protein